MRTTIGLAIRLVLWISAGVALCALAACGFQNDREHDANADLTRAKAEEIRRSAVPVTREEWDAMVATQKAILDALHASLSQAAQQALAPKAAK